MEFIPGRMLERIFYSGNEEFTIGQRYRSDNYYMLIGNSGEPVGANPHYFRLVEEDVSKRLQDMNYSALEVRVIAQVMNKEDNMYTFQVSSEDAIDHQEIMDTLTRKRPVAIVKLSDGMHTVIIHDSLWNKVYHVDQVLKDKLFAAMDAYLPGGYLHLSSKHLGVVLGLLRELRTAPYVNRKKLTVSVETLEF